MRPLIFVISKDEDLDRAVKSAMQYGNKLGLQGIGVEGVSEEYESKDNKAFIINAQEVNKSKTDGI